MALEDLVPEDKRSSTSSSSSSRKPPEERDDMVVFGSGDTKKSFTDDKWDDVKRALIDEMGLNPSEVTNNFPAQKRFDALHEAALIAEKEEEAEDLGYTPETCSICNKAVGDSGVEIEGETVHIQHTAGQIAELLKDD